MDFTPPHTGTYFHAAGRYGPNQRRRAEALKNTGCRHSAVSKWSGALVSVYNAEEAMIDADTRWVCVCEDHGSLLDAETITEAKYRASVPDWCAGCYAKAEEVSAYLDRWEKHHGRKSRRDQDDAS